MRDITPENGQPPSPSTLTPAEINHLAEPTNTQIQLAQRLVDQLLQHHGCQNTDHNSTWSVQTTSPSESNHPAFTPTTTTSLQELSRSVGPDVLSEPNIQKHRTDWDEVFPLAHRRELYTGIGTQATANIPPAIDVDQGSIIPSIGDTEIWFDIDSAGGLASSLAVAREGLVWTTVRPPVSNLHSGLHLPYIPVTFLDPEQERWRSTKQPVHRIPHIPLGRLQGLDGVEVYILFPQLFHPSRDHGLITKDEFTLWMDDIFLPALHQTYPGTILNRVPPTAEDAYLRGTAVSSETTTQQDGRTPRIQQASKALQPAHLHHLWQAIQGLVDRGRDEFRDMSILITAKDLKGLTQDRTWIGAKTKFLHAWQGAVDTRYLRDDFYDIGKEVVVSGRSYHALEEPLTPSVSLSWRKCCLTAFSHWLGRVEADLARQERLSVSSPSPTPISHRTRSYSRPPHNSDPTLPAPVEPGESQERDEPIDQDDPDDPDFPQATHEIEDPAHPGLSRDKKPWRQEFYPFALLRDIGSLTIEPSTGSQLRKHGLLYCQHYNTSKEIFAAGNHYPFSNPALDTLALDPGLVRMWRHVGGALSHSPLSILRAYLHTKRRCDVALQNCSNRSYSTREEYRIRGPLFRAIDVTLTRRARSSPFRSREGTERRPPPYFCHLTTDILNWLRWNINRLCLGFELVYSLHPPALVHWEHTRVMMTFLRALMYVAGGQGAHPRRCNVLWIDHRVRPPEEGSDAERIDEGLGWGTTITEFGYAWFRDKIDWQSMTFARLYRRHLPLRAPSLLAAYHARYRQVMASHQDFVFIHDVLERLQARRAEPRQSALLLQLVIDVCLRAFRQDVFAVLIAANLSEPLDGRALDDARAGRIPLTLGGLHRVFRHVPCTSVLRFVASRRAHIQSTRVLCAWLWGWAGDGNHGDWQRKHWESKPYRVLARQCFDTIAQVHGLQQARAWRVALQHTFIRTHWVVPYPSPRQFWPRAAASGHGPTRLQTWASTHPGLIRYYSSQPSSGPRVIFTPVDLPTLPLTGWQRGDRPLPYDVDLPPIPTDLDAYLATVPSSSSEPLPPGALVFPAVRSIPSPIQEYLDQSSPSQRILRSFTQEHLVTPSDVHKNVDWLTNHLVDFLRAAAEAHRQEALDLSIPHTLQKQRAWTQAAATEFRGLSVTHHDMEEDSDPENIGKQREQHKCLYKRKQSTVTRAQTLLKQLWEQHGIMYSSRNTPVKGKSREELDTIIERKFRPAREKMRQIRQELAELSQTAASMENRQA